MKAPPFRENVVFYCPSILDKSKINKVERLLWFQSKQSMLCIAFDSLFGEISSQFFVHFSPMFLGNDPISSTFIPLPWTIVDFLRNFIQFETHICFNSENFSTQMESIHPKPTFSDVSTGSNRKLHTRERRFSGRTWDELITPPRGRIARKG